MAEDYRATLHLPRTEFPMKADLVKREPETLARWERLNLYEQLRAARRGAPRFVLHDGPPFANGQAHLGHLVNNVLKDAVVRYKIMRGFDVPFVPGWDCHGQAIEHNYLKQSGLNPRDVDPLDLRRACRDYAMKWVRVQREQRKRVGALGDWEHPYLTMDKDMTAAEIECVGRLIRAGYIFRGKKPVLWCASCETALAENSVEHGPHVAPSVYVRFPVTAWPPFLATLRAQLAKPVSAVIWTTTPWTLPATVAIAFNPRLTYDLIDTGSEVLLMARELAPGVLGLAGIKDAKVVASVEGRALEGLACAHPFAPKRASQGILAEYVTLEAGSGIVHIAPGHGLEDFASGVEYRLPVLAPVDAQGRFTVEFPEFAGVHVFEANAGIVASLKQKGALLHEGVIEHAYPFCWKCKNPVIFRATEQWFISLDHERLKQRAVAAARGAAWHPAAGAERMGSMIDQRPDWCISRQRSWGVPIPVFYCLSCGQVLATEGSLNAVRDWVAQEGADVWWTREPEVLLPRDTRCQGCGGRKFKKETDTLDPWFDSGVTHTSVLRAREDLSAPADLYVEAVDQFRGWFQSSLLTSVALHGAAPYKAVLVSGWVLDPQGLKMSKSLGNVLSLDDAVGRWGADVMRLWTLAGNFHEDMLLTEQGISGVTDAYRKFRNTLRYLLGNVADLAEGDEAPREVDAWMRWRLAVLVRDVTADMDAYEFFHAAQRLQKFCVVELSAFYLDLLKDRLYASPAGDPARRAAQSVLAETFSALVRMLAPFLPFTAEEAWVHAPAALRDRWPLLAAAPWPEPAPPGDAGGLAARWERFMALRDAVLKSLEGARQAKTIESALAARVILEADGGWREFVASMGDGLRELLIVSQAELGGTAAGLTS
ncbi:MAG: isoleucine--tRNA ligase, partial [bacterium]